MQIDALVTSDGKPVRGLTAADFEVRDNGVVQTVDFVSFDERPVNVILALDMSRSVAGLKLERLRDAGRALLDGLRKDDRAALITFSHVVAGRSLLTARRRRGRRSARRRPALRRHALVDGTYAALALGDPEDGRSLAIVFSDGLDSASFLTADAVTAAARRTNVVVYGVATGESPHGVPPRSHERNRRTAAARRAASATSARRSWKSSPSSVTATCSASHRGAWRKTAGTSSTSASAPRRRRSRRGRAISASRSAARRDGR